MPVAAKTKAGSRRAPKKADYTAFLAAAGSWKDVDVEKFKANIYASQRLARRPPVML